MTGEKTETSLFKKILKNPLLYWIILWTATGFGLTFIFEKIGLETAKQNAWQVANFLILLTVLYYFAKDPFREYLSKRKAGIAQAIEEAKQMLNDTEKSYDDLEYKMEWIEDEITGIETRIREEAERERNRLIEEAQKQIERIKNEAEFTARQEVKSAQASLKEVAIKKAMKIAEEILKKQLTEKDDTRLFEEFIREVERGSQN